MFDFNNPPDEVVKAINEVIFNQNYRFVQYHPQEFLIVQEELDLVSMCFMHMLSDNWVAYEYCEASVILFQNSIVLENGHQKSFLIFTTNMLN
jgi:hypothetical protein